MLHVGASNIECQSTDFRTKCSDVSFLFYRHRAWDGDETAFRNRVRHFELGRQGLQPNTVTVSSESRRPATVCPNLSQIRGQTKNIWACCEALSLVYRDSRRSGCHNERIHNVCSKWWVFALYPEQVTLHIFDLCPEPGCWCSDVKLQNTLISLL